MSEDAKEAAGAILGFVFGGVILLLMAPELNQVSVINLTGLGVIFLFAAVLLGGAFVYAVIRSVVP